MSRWVVKRITVLQLWARDRGDSGQTSFEYLGIAVVIAIIIAALATTNIGGTVGQAILDAIGKIAKI
ncbi:hypothetical protein [Actinacidiphila oryziradicis]|uniref:hypothetical protein n=1 Tax=Actinacidiphila oryziradicis TaxID=2571141 RepID=UPI00145EB70F|nr:hypothetical protein [Actinacidiphila oryziradicis]